MDSRKKRDLDMADYFEFLSKSAPESEFEEEDAVLNMEVDFDEGDTENENDDEDGDANDDDDDSNNYDYGNNYDGTNDNNNDEDASTTMDEDQTYDSNADMPEIDAKGNYTLDLIGQQKLSRQERSATVNHLELPEATESTLMAHIDHSKFKKALTLVV